MTKEIIDGYEVNVTESRDFLTEVEEAALLLLDPSYFGGIPRGSQLTDLEIKSLGSSALPKWNHSVPRPSEAVSDKASKLSPTEFTSILTRLASHLQPLCVVRLRCGEIYCGSALNYFYSKAS